LRILVTGAGGFIGGALAGHLTGIGHDVLLHRGRSDGRVEVPREVEAVVNAAGSLDTGGISEKEAEAANAELPEILGGMCAEAGIPLVHLSTPGVCGLIAGSREDSPFSPEGLYERTKADGERRLAMLDLPPGRLTVLRPDFVFGPGDRHKLALFRQAARGWFPVVGGKGPMTRPTHVRDVCRAVEASLPGGILQGGLFNIGGPEVLSMARVARAAGRAAGVRTMVLPAPRWLFRIALALGPLRPPALSNSRLRLFGTDRWVSIDKAAVAGFTPLFTFRAAAEEAVAWYRLEGLL
jgi:nucleoside-diphosphate-sugar epimerase